MSSQLLLFVVCTYNYHLLRFAYLELERHHIANLNVQNNPIDVIVTDEMLSDALSLSYCSSVGYLNIKPAPAVMYMCILNHRDDIILMCSPTSCCI